MFTEDITALVVDPGSLNMRAGYSGEDNPRMVFPSQVGIDMITELADQQEMEQEVKKKKYLAGDNNLMITKEEREIEHTYLQGQIVNEDGFEAILRLIYDQIQATPQDYSLLMSESSICDQLKLNNKQRETLCEIAFEKLNVPNFFLAKSGVLSSFSSGRQTSLVLDSGAYTTYAVPVFDGYCLRKSTIKYDIGGEFLTEILMQHFDEKTDKKIYPRYQCKFGYDEQKQQKVFQGLNELPKITDSYHKYAKLEVLRDLKEHICKVDDKNQSLTDRELERSSYHLPDGTILNIDSTATEYGEYFFSRQRLNDQQENSNFIIPQKFQEGELLNFKGVQNMIIDSINSCDVDIKKELYQNIIVTGGNSLLNGFCSRLQQKLNDAAPPNSKVKMIAYPSPSERKYSSWIGGSILASLGSFQSLWVGQKEYQEQGKSIIDKKFP